MTLYEETLALLDDQENAVTPPPGKFEGTTDLRIAEKLYALAGEGSVDDQWGSVEEGGWFGLIGRFVVWEDDQGFFGYDWHDSEHEAKIAFLGH